MKLRATAPVVALLAFTLTACAGFRGGWESVAYVGDAPAAPPTPAGSAYEASQRPPLELSGMSLRVTIDNRVRDYDTQVWFFAVPVKIDPRTVETNVTTPGRTRVRLAVTPTQPGLVFSPRRAVLSFGGRQFQGIAGYEFARAAADSNGPVQWRDRPVESDLALQTTQEPYLLSIDFDTPPPSPEAADITIDLSTALSAPGLAAPPLIRFVPVRWKEGYT